MPVPVGSAVTIGRRYVAAPPFTPLPFGLLSVADPLSEGTTRWEAGVEYQPDDCGEALITIDECIISGAAVSGVGTKAPSATGIGVNAAEPFTVYSWILCSPVGVYEEYEQRTINALSNGEGRAVERTFWTGVIGGVEQFIQHLASDETITDPFGAVMQTAATPVTTGAAIDVVEAIGLLEGNLAECYGGVGVIHVPRQALAHLVAYDLAERDGQRLRSPGGNIIAAYSSNNREGPNGVAPAAGQAWFYATGNLQIRRSGIRTISQLPEALNRSENSMVLIAERTYVIDWDCCHYAAQVSLGGIITGGVQAA